MTNATITRPEWSTVIDPVLQKELEQHVLVTNWDKLLGIVDTVYNWGRRSALWPLGFGLACCAIEMICTASSRFDIARFGAEVFRGSPRQADLMIVSGTVTKTMMPMIARLYDQMPEPKYVISMGACATGGGPFKEGYNVVSGVDKYIPVDVYIPGCPPTPQALLNGLIMLQKKIDGERLEIPLWANMASPPGMATRSSAIFPIPVLGPGPDRPAHGRDRRRTDGDGPARRSTKPGSTSPPRSPRRSPSREAEPAAGSSRRPRAQGDEQDRHDPRQGAGRSRAPTPPPPARAGRRSQAGTGRQGRAKRSSGPRPGPPWSGWATPGSTSWPSGSMPSSAPGPSRSSRPASSSSPTSWSTSPSICATRTRSSTTTWPACRACTTKTASRSTTSSTARRKPGTLIELRVRTAEAEGAGRGPVALSRVSRGRLPGARSLRHDGRPVHGPPRADAHPDVGRLRLLPASQGFPRALLRGTDQGLCQPGRRGPRPALPRRGDQSVRHQHEGPQGLQGLGKPLEQRRSQGGGPLARRRRDRASSSTDQFVVSMGPQHPSTHGVFRLNLRVDGETIIGLKPVMGYMHRNHEKIGERNTFLMNFPFTDRLDYLTSMGNNFGYALAVEQLMGDDAKPPERAEYIRVIMAELTRIASHMWSIGFLLNDLGAFFTPALYAIEERELILDLFEWAAGSRMMCNYFRFGGVAFDLPPGWIERCRGIVNDRIDGKIDELDRYLSGNEIVLDRCKGVGVLTREQAINYSTAGPGAACLGRGLRHPPGRPLQHLRPV